MKEKPHTLRILCAATLWAVSGLATTSPVREHVAYVPISLGSLRFHAVVADIRSSAIEPVTVLANRCVSPRQLIGGNKTIAAVTGTFFAPSTQKPIADVLVDGNLVARGRRGTVVAVDWNGQVEIFDVGHQRSVSWWKYRYGMRGTVRIVRSGAVAPDPKAQKFQDKRIWGRAARAGLGVTRSGKLCFVATTAHVTLTELGKAMRSIGVVDGVSVDGGGSTCLYFNDQFLVPPKRNLNNLWLIRKTN